MMRNVKRAGLAAILAFAAVAAAAVAQVRPLHGLAPVIHPPVVTAPIVQNSPKPLPQMSLKPIALPSATLPPIDLLKKKRYVHAVRSGERVPLFRLPRLPMKSPLNTIVPGRGHHGGRFRPLAATGATIGITAAASCTTGGTIGALFNVGCQLTIQASGLSGWSGTDSYQYYVVPPNATTATEIGGAVGGCTPTTDPWTGSSPPSCTNGTTTTLSTAGTYGFFAYDTTKQVLAAAVYVNAGPIFSIQVFQDPFHTEPSYQYDTSSSTAAYVYLQNVAPSDSYVMYVMSTGVNAYCVYMSPSGSPTPAPPSPRPTGSPNKLVCNPSTATGVNAPGGNLALTWPFNSNLESGAYEIEIFDQSANNGAGELLGSVQVSLTAFAAAAILTEGSTPAPNPSAGPNAPSSTTQVAWDSTNDQAVAGITGTTQGSIPAGTYTWSISDPDGQVLATASETLASNGIATHDFVFSSLAMNPPGEYPSANWVLQLYNPSAHQVLGSQAFQILGYSSQTQFDESGTFSASLNFPAGGGTYTVYTVNSGLRITNTGNSVYPNEADSFSELEYSTGVEGSATAMNLPPSGTQSGVYVTLGTGNPAISTCYPSCSLTVNDSSGNSWKVTDYCSSSTYSRTGACALLYTPVNASTVLSPGSYIDIPTADMTWYAQGANYRSPWPCYYTPCSAPTSVLPQHGLAWSSTSANSPAWTVTTFGSNISGGTLSGTAGLSIAGSCTYTGTNCTTSRSTTAPYSGTHFYKLNFLQGDYQLSTPFTPTSGRSDIVGFNVTNTSTVNGDSFSQLAIGFPAYFTISQVHLDSLTSANWTTEACPNSFGPTYVCLSDGNNNDLPSNGGNTTVYLDVPMTISSFGINEFNVQAYDSGELLWQGLSATGAAAQPICGGGTTCASGNIDGLGFETYSLNSGLQSASFQPSTIGTGTNPTSLSLVVQNTSSAADPNPDPIDAIVVEQTTSNAWQISGTPTLSNVNWSSLSGTGYNVAGNAMEYWYGVCANQYNNHTSYPGGGPPQSPPSPTNPSGIVTTQVTPCTTGQEENALAAGGSLTINFALNTAFSAGTQTFYVYTHGANGGGWSAPKPVTLTINNESASANLFSVNGVTVSNGSVATVGGTPNTFVYEIKNTSNTAHITTTDITLPAYDINGQPATDGTYSWSLVGSPITQNIVLGTISGGTFTTSGVPAGCAVSSPNTYNPVAGTSNGQIEVTGCTGFAPGTILAVKFESNTPQTQSDSYLLPVKIDGTTAGLAWIGADRVTVSFSIGLSVVVDPSNPGPGGSTPIVNCSQCAFSGTTIDYGPIANNSSVSGADVVRASVVYTGATQAGKTWQLSVSSNINPACAGAACGGILNELLTSADPSKTDTPAGNSNTNCAGGSIHVTQTTYAAMPTGTPLDLATGSENQCTGTEDYDVLQNYKVQVGTEATNGEVVTIVYTLVAN